MKSKVKFDGVPQSSILGEFHLQSDMLRVMDLVCTGLESGCYGSFTIVGYEKPKEIKYTIDGFHNTSEKGRVYRHIDYPFNEGGAVLFKIKDDYAETKEEQDTTYRLDRAALAKGMQIFMEKVPHCYADWIKENDDALTGDAFIQCCLLGDVVYG